MPNENLLNSEQALAELLKELAKLKSAAEQIESSRQSANDLVEKTQQIAKAITDAVAKVVQQSTELADTGKQVLTKLEGMQIREQYDAISTLLRNVDTNDRLILQTMVDLTKRIYDWEKSLGEQKTKIGEFGQKTEDETNRVLELEKRIDFLGKNIVDQGDNVKNVVNGHDRMEQRSKQWQLILLGIFVVQLILLIVIATK